MCDLYGLTKCVRPRSATASAPATIAPALQPCSRSPGCRSRTGRRRKREERHPGDGAGDGVARLLGHDFRGLRFASQRDLRRGRARRPLKRQAECGESAHLRPGSVARQKLRACQGVRLCATSEHGRESGDADALVRDKRTQRRRQPCSSCRGAPGQFVERGAQGLTNSAATDEPQASRMQRVANRSTKTTERGSPSRAGSRPNLPSWLTSLLRGHNGSMRSNWTVSAWPRGSRAAGRDFSNGRAAIGPTNIRA